MIIPKKRDRLNAVIGKLDFNYFTNDLAEKMPSLGAFVDGLEKFFQEDFKPVQHERKH
jgi:hypothetical protein